MTKVSKFWVDGLAVLRGIVMALFLSLILCAAASAQSLSSLADTVLDPARGLSNASSLTEEHDALIESARDIVMDWTKDQAKEKFIDFAGEGTTKNLAGHLRSVQWTVRRRLPGSRAKGDVISVRLFAQTAEHLRQLHQHRQLLFKRQQSVRCVRCV